jgi:hypothetical protein
MQPIDVAQKLYETRIKDWPIVERLRLVKLVLDDLMTAPPTWIVEENDIWSDDDLADLSRASLVYASELASKQVE